MIEANQIVSHIEQILKRYYPLGIKDAVDPISDYLDKFDTTPIEVTNYLKSVVQAEALQAWKDNGKMGLITMATGTGKSKIVVDYFKSQSLNESDYNVIIVPTERLRDKNWEDEFTKWDGDCELRFTKKYCYASIANKEIETYNTIVLDEGHCITEGNISFLHNNKYKNLMVLTATPPQDRIKQKLLQELGIKVVYELPLDIAVKLRLVSPYEVVIVETKLDDTIKNIKGGTKKALLMLTEKNQYAKLSATVNKFMYMNGATAKTLLKFAMIKRMRFVYDLPSKLEAAKFIKSLLPQEDRNLIFCGSIDQSKELSDYCYNSKTNDQCLNEFVSGAINELACVNALNEGINIGLVNNALVVQLNSNERVLIQRLGRVIRYTENHIAKIIIICCVETKDLSWVNKATESLDKEKIRRIKYKDLVEGIEKL